MNKKLLLLFISLISYAVSAEVSVFGAGDLNSKNPYGLTQTEEHILKNKKVLGSIDTKVKTVKSTITTINERIDGLESIYEGDSLKLNSAVLKINELVSDNDINKVDISNLKELTAQIMVVQDDIKSENKKNLASLKKAIKNLTSLVNKINNNYISSKEFKKNMNQFVTKKEFDSLIKSLNKSSSTKTTVKTPKKKAINKKLSKDDSALMLVEAKRLFKKDYFTKAIPMFETLIANKFKPAESNFYLGEIWYHRKKYDKAIGYFKTSATLYDKASWMPKLLLHSAISFEQTGDLSNAASFYSTLVDSYPETKESKTAYEKLSKLN